MIKKNAFTLAEVLIVMALIGFLFTLMIPNIIQKQSTTKYIELVHTTQTTLQTAFSKAAADNDGLFPQDWKSVRESHNKSEAIVKEIAKKTSVISFCGDTHVGCFANSEYRTLNGVITNVLTEEMKHHQKTRSSKEYIAKEKSRSGDIDYSPRQLRYETADPRMSATYFTLLNGGAVVLKTNSKYCDGIIPSLDPIERPYCAEIIVDVNGQSIPNMLGVDVFGFYLSGNDLIPMGFYGDNFNFNYNCLRETPNSTASNGLACTAWAIKNKNMDYRKCQAGSRLSWTGAKHCNTEQK